MGSTTLTTPVLDHETLSILKREITNFSQISDDVIEKISIFNWLWPIVELKCFNGSACLRSIQSYFNNANSDDLFQQESVSNAYEFFERRYGLSENPNYRFEALLNTRGRNLRSPILVGYSENANNSQRVIALALICYRLRNNLFHGTKAGIGIADQADNFQQTNLFLKSLLDNEAH